jgi:hypothetical protein
MSVPARRSLAVAYDPADRWSDGLAPRLAVGPWGRPFLVCNKGLLHDGGRGHAPVAILPPEPVFRTGKNDDW